MVLALVDGMPVGCVLLRGIGADTGEMKRLFVRPAFHDIGIACALVRRLAELALVRGYKTLKLETGPLHKEAQTLYRALGFQQARAHHEIADRIASHMLFFEAGASHVAHRAAQTVDKARWRHEQPWQRPWAALCARLDSWYLMPDTGVPGARTNEFFHRQHRRACPLTFVAPGLADPR
jgi:N-acetylglutamate synthase-like GNAT family acetyltransferase